MGLSCAAAAKRRSSAVCKLHVTAFAVSAQFCILLEVRPPSPRPALGARPSAGAAKNERKKSRGREAGKGNGSGGERISSEGFPGRKGSLAETILRGERDRANRLVTK